MYPNLFNSNKLGVYNQTVNSGVGYQPQSSFSLEMEEKAKKISAKDISIDAATKILNKILATDIVPFLWGPPGIGKSSLVKQICLDKNWKIIDLRLSLLNPVDLRGLPHFNKESGTIDWVPPSFLPKEDGSQGVLFLDEINLAPVSVQSAAYQLILDKKIGEYQFPKGWKIVAAGNREIDKANVYKISAPLANRFVHIDMYANFDSWRKWASGKIRNEVVDFLLLRPTLLLKMPTNSEKAFPSPRSWEFVSNFISLYDDDSGVSDNLKSLVIGSIGEAVGREFLAFFQDYKEKNVQEIIKKFINTGELSMPKEISLRWTIIAAVLKHNKEGSVNHDYYKKFNEELTKEEVEMIKAWRDKKKLTDTQINLNQ